MGFDIYFQKWPHLEGSTKRWIIIGVAALSAAELLHFLNPDTVLSQSFPQVTLGLVTVILLGFSALWIHDRNRGI